MEREKLIVGAAALFAVAAIGYVVALKLIERKFRRLPWYKRALLIAVQMLPGR